MNSRASIAKRLGPAIITVVAICWWAYGTHQIRALPPEIRVQFVPDDAYYYLALARNFVNQGQWTFDSGVSQTSGFHPLLAYLLAAGYSLTDPSVEQFVSLGLWLSFVAAIPAVLVAAFFAVRSGSLLAAMLLSLFLVSHNVLLNSVAPVEWSLVVSLAALYCLVFRRFWQARYYAGPIALGLIGCLGSLARTDFGLLPAALAVASLPAFRGNERRQLAAGAFAGLAGAVLGVLIDLGHNYLLTGQYLQSSAQMKSLWLATYGPSPSRIAAQTLTLFGAVSWATKAYVAILVTITTIHGIRTFFRHWFYAGRYDKTRDPSNGKSADDVLWFGSLFTVVGYIAFYSLNPVGIQHWYTAGTIVPIFLVIVLPFLHVGPARVAHVAVLGLLVALIGKQVLHEVHRGDDSEWRHHTAMYKAGNYLNEHLPESRVGSWNAGIIGYYQGGRVINLDGLVNNDIVEYAASNELPQYIEENGIEYILDFDRMFLLRDLRKRGGYDSPAFLDRLRPIKRFAESSHEWYGLTLYRLSEASPGQTSPADERPQ